jgi:hypothetical protein
LYPQYLPYLNGVVPRRLLRANEDQGQGQPCLSLTSFSVRFHL